MSVCAFPPDLPLSPSSPAAAARRTPRRSRPPARPPSASRRSTRARATSRRSASTKVTCATGQKVALAYYRCRTRTVLRDAASSRSRATPARVRNSIETEINGARDLHAWDAARSSTPTSRTRESRRRGAGSRSHWLVARAPGLTPRSRAATARPRATPSQPCTNPRSSCTVTPTPDEARDHAERRLHARRRRRRACALRRRPIRRRDRRAGRRLRTRRTGAAGDGRAWRKRAAGACSSSPARTARSRTRRPRLTEAGAADCVAYNQRRGRLAGRATRR